MSTPAATLSQTLSPTQADNAAAAILAAAEAAPAETTTNDDGGEKLNLRNIFDGLDAIAPAPEGDTEVEGEPTETTETTEDPETPEPERKEKVDAVPAAKGRDLTKFEERDRPYLKQMSKPAFDHFSKRLQGMSTAISQRDELVKGLETRLAEVSDKKLPDNWYEDPEAGRLSPEYRETEKAFQEAQAQTHQLTDLLAQYEGGEIKWDAAGNRFIPNDDETPINPRMRQQLADARQTFYEKQKDLATKGNTVLESFGKHYKADVDFTKSWVDTQFPWVKDEKHANQEVYKACLSQIKPSLRKSPLAPVVGTLGTAALMWAQRATAAEKELATLKANVSDRRRGGPSPNGRSSRPAVDQDDDKKFAKPEDIFN